MIENRDPRLSLVRRRAEEADGAFVFGVRTTKIYCRPSCAAKPAKAENIAFFETPERARAAGYRPCKRCAPDRAHSPRAEILARACALLDSAEEPLAVSALAARLGVGARQLQRLFKSALGLSPTAYARAARAARLRSQLEAGEAVTRAAFDAGYGSLARANAEADRRLGMTPSAYKAAGAGETIRIAKGRSELGWVAIAATPRGICAIDLGEDPEALEAALRRRFANARLIDADAELEGWLDALLTHIALPRRSLELPIDVRGSAFRERVWRALDDIPLGETRSYGEIAAAIGSPGAARAVGAALGANPVPIARPCHRVTPQSGGQGGYRLGGSVKAALLERERRARLADPPAEPAPNRRPKRGSP